MMMIRLLMLLLLDFQTALARRDVVIPSIFLVRFVRTRVAERGPPVHAGG